MEHEHTTGSDQRCDVVVVGGGAAGLGAALQLARARRSVVVVDAGEPRNAPAAHMHAYLGYDGRPPADLLAVGREEASGYGARFVAGSATHVTRLPGAVAFSVALADGSVVSGRRVLLATGLVDELPDLPGVREQWGRGVIHCPYCHGWEVRDQRLVVLATSALGAHQALLFRQLSDRVTVVEHEVDVLAEDDRLRLTARGVRIRPGPAAEVVVDADVVRGVRLADGQVVEADAVVVAPRFVARSEPVRALGIAPVPAPMGTGEMIETDARGATSVVGVYAAGNVADVSHQVLQAAAEGSRVAAAINADLAHEDAVLALADDPGDGAEAWDRRYGREDRWWSGHPNASLLAEAGHLPPGTALDVGCGEGADAIWLAEQGWQVTGLDIAQVALDRAARAAADAGVAVDWVRADLAVAPPAPGRYDLVTAHYPALRRDDDVIDAMVLAVAPGGTLLVVGHDVGHGGHHRVDGRDPDRYVQPADVVRRLDASWVIDVHETRPRVPPPGHTGPDVPDVVLRAHRA